MARVRATRYVQVGGKTLPLKRVKGVMQMLPNVTMEATAVQMRVAAEETRELLIDKILAGSPAAPATATAQRPPRISRSKVPTSDRKPFSLAPLSPAYVKEKARRGEDGRTLVATGDYIAGIQVKKADLPGAGVAWGIGLEPRAHEPSGLPLVVLANILERGSAAANVPARPHWRPTRRIVLRSLRRGARDIQAEALRLLLREAR
jgi:hypothetical protein